MDKPVTDYFGFPNQSGIYDNFRPKYPQQIVDEIIAVCGRKAAERVENVILGDCENHLKRLCAVDIACGTGLFTRMIAPYFGRVVGIDISQSQLEVAQSVNESSSGLYSNVTYMNYDAFELETVLKEAGISSSDVCLVTVAEALHWLDIPRFLDMITTLFPRGFVFAPVQYHFPPEIMTNQVSDLPNLINPELRESYPDELILCNQHVNEVCTSLTNYLMCDHSWMETCFKDKNFEKYFPECKFLEFSELKNSNLFGLKQLLMSISSYNNFRDKNKEKLDTGEIEDPLEVMSRNFLNSLSKEQSFEITQTDEVLRSVGLQFLWRYFVHILSN